MLPKDCLEDLRYLMDKRIIKSVSQGIRLAVEDFIAAQKRIAYENAILEAAEDEAYIGRTIDTQNDFAFVDAEAESW